MEKQYYDLIISLMKNHKKYSDCEPIAEDIANHVYKQAETILKTVSDENVLAEYLNKLISTAFIVVPRQMNFTINKPTTKTVPIELPLPEVEELEDKPTEDIEFIEETEVLEEIEDILEDTETTEEEIEDILEDTKTTEEEIEELIEEEIEEALVNKNEAENIEHTTSCDVDKNLVDKMINGVSSTAFDEVDENRKNELEEGLNELYDSIETFSVDQDDDTLEETAELTENLDLTAENENMLVEEVAEELLPQSELDLDIETNITETENSLEEFEEPENIEYFDLVENNEDTIEMLDDEIQNNETEELEILEVLEELDEVAEDFEEAEELDEVAELVLEENEENTFVETETVLSNKNKLTNNTASEEFADYIETLRSYDQMYPQKQILKICMLKYNQNLTIAEISEQTNIDIDTVLETLNEIIELIKD